MNRPIVTLPYQSGAAASPSPAQPADIATPTATSVGAQTRHTSMLDVTATLRAANSTNTANTVTTANTPSSTESAAESPTTARAAAATDPVAPRSVTSEATSPSADGTVRSGGLRIGPTHVIGWQVAVVMVAVALRARIGPVVTIAPVTGALTLVAITAVPIRDAWLHQWLGIALRYRLRRGQAELPSTGGMATTLLGLWLGDTSIDVGFVRERPLALISHRVALGAMLGLDTSSSARIREALDSLLSNHEGTILAALDERPVDLEGQLVIDGGLRQDHEPHDRLAIAAHRHVGLSTDEQLATVLENAVRRLQRHLDRVGVSTVPIDEGEAVTTLMALIHADAGRGHLHERWSALSAGPVSQVCLRLGGFGRLTPADAEGALLSNATGAALMFSAGARLPRGTWSTRRHDPVLRVAATSPGASDLAVTVLVRVAGAWRRNDWTDVTDRPQRHHFPSGGV